MDLVEAGTFSFYCAPAEEILCKSAIMDCPANGADLALEAVISRKERRVDGPVSGRADGGCVSQSKRIS